MGPEVLAYPFLFIALYFESFLLVTLLSKPARLARGRAGAGAVPTVAVIVPCYNEEATVTGTCESLLALEYPADKLEIILVNDGSTDGTSSAIARLAGHPQLRIISKENGGKHTALNAGIAVTNAEFVGCLDADSFVEPDALHEIISRFADARVGAVTAAMSVHQPRSILQHMQHAEYIFGITMRHAMSSINGLYVTPGPFSFYRRSVIKELGDFRYGHQTEDMEMALRIQRAGYKIENAVRARVYTKTPHTLAKLVKQRTRWTSGFLRNVLGEYRHLLGNRAYGVLGILILPGALLAVAGGILLFLLMIFQFTDHAVAAVSIRAGIPLSYVFVPHGPFDWFYFPINFFLLLGAVMLLASLMLVAVGKHLSNTPGNLRVGFISYFFLYGLVVPLWLMRATSDVAFGIRRGWRY